jgi:exodeoxyribonuclease VII small subunit
VTTIRKGGSDVAREGRRRREVTATSPTSKEGMERLEKIVAELESGELSLEDSIAPLREGMKLQRQLTDVLNHAEKRIERLVRRRAGAPTTAAMELSGRESSEGELPL